MGIKLKGSMETTSISPGPGAYVSEKVIHDNLSYSMGIKLKGSMETNSIAPGPGTYRESFVNKESVKNTKFGSGQRG